MALLAGTLARHRIAIEEATEAQDGYGAAIPTWGMLATVWAEKKDLSGRELFQAQQVNAQTTTQFTIRHRGDVTAKMRVKHDGIYYNVESWQDPDGLEVMMILLCSREAQ